MFLWRGKKNIDTVILAVVLSFNSIGVILIDDDIRLKVYSENHFFYVATKL